MFYSLLGRIVWFAAKRYARRRYGWLRPSRPVLAGSVLALVLAVALVGQRSRTD
jgi:hypothetical protein